MDGDRKVTALKQLQVWISGTDSAQEYNAFEKKTW
jgi:hypothetical protein